MNEYGGIELIKEQEDIYKIPKNEEGDLKDAFCVDKDGNFIPIFFVKIGSFAIAVLFISYIVPKPISLIISPPY